MEYTLAMSAQDLSIKKITVLVLFLLFAAVFSLFPEEIDTLWIVKDNAGSVSSLERLGNPDFSPSDTLYLYVAVKDLTVRWGEGQVKWKYYYQSSNGKVIWSSPFKPVSRPFSGDSWNFSEIVSITLPASIPAGTYRLGFTLVDGHSLKEYRGWLDFSVGMGSETAGADSAPAFRTFDAAAVIEEVELRLISIEKDSYGVMFNFSGVNRGIGEQPLSLYPYGSRIIDSEGNEFVFSEVGGGGSLADGVLFPPDVQVRTELYFKRPALDAESIALLFLSFYDTDDVLEIRSVSVPWP
jgi:hypothetical protein